jgi:hypothetical protein
MRFENERDQNALFNPSLVLSEKAPFDILPFANFHSTRDLTQADQGDLGTPVYQTISRHDVEASPPIPEGSQDAAAVVFAKYIEITSAKSSEYPKLGLDAIVTTEPLEQDGFNSPDHDRDNLVKGNVSSPGVRFASSTRRKVEARFVCRIEGCGGTFTRKKNLERMIRHPSPFRWLMFLYEDHLNSHRGIRNHICPCRRSFNTKAGLKRHQVRSCIMLGRQ